jgi:imidazolonepropionase
MQLTTIFINIKQLVGATENYKQLRGQELNQLPSIDDAFVLVEGERIVEYGAMADLSILVPTLPQHVVDCTGKMLLPSWCDSHTHIVFAGSRENEFVDKLTGLTYADIAAKGGGILNSAAKLLQTSEADLYEAAHKRLMQLAALGTGAIEIKSGYGLTVEAELKMLRVIKQLKDETGFPIKATLLAAHTYPLPYKENHQGYINEIIHELLPTVAAEKLADFIDVFCESGFFSAEETNQICEAAAKYGLPAKLHINQLNSIGGVEVGIKNNAVSLDHLETLTDHEIAQLGNYNGSSTLLPTAAFFLRMPLQPARALIQAGAAVALASDYNPGSSPSGNMNFVAALSCIQMKMLPNEVINAAIINGAFAMQLEHEVGSISRGKLANFIITKPIPSLAYLFYAFGENHIDTIIFKGKKL